MPIINRNSPALHRGCFRIILHYWGHCARNFNIKLFSQVLVVRSAVAQQSRWPDGALNWPSLISTKAASTRSSPSVPRSDCPQRTSTVLSVMSWNKKSSPALSRVQFRHSVLSISWYVSMDVFTLTQDEPLCFQRIKMNIEYRGHIDEVHFRTVEVAT